MVDRGQHFKEGHYHMLGKYFKCLNKGIVNNTMTVIIESQMHNFEGGRDI